MTELFGQKGRRVKDPKSLKNDEKEQKKKKKERGGEQIYPNLGILFLIGISVPPL